VSSRRLKRNEVTCSFGGVEESDLLQSLVESSIDTHVIPLRSHGQMNERRIALFDRGIEMTRRLVEMTRFTEQQGELPLHDADRLGTDVKRYPATTCRRL